MTTNSYSNRDHMVTGMNILSIVFNKEKNEINVTKHVNSIGESETALYADTKERDEWAVVCRYTTRDDTRGWLGERRFSTFLSPGREQAYHRKGRRLR